MVPPSAWGSAATSAERVGWHGCLPAPRGAGGGRRTCRKAHRCTRRWGTLSQAQVSLPCCWAGPVDFWRKPPCCIPAHLNPCAWYSYHGHCAPSWLPPSNWPSGTTASPPPASAPGRRQQSRACAQAHVHARHCQGPVAPTKQMGRVPMHCATAVPIKAHAVALPAGWLCPARPAQYRHQGAPA